MPEGVPLYPVETMRSPRIKTAPTLRPLQLARPGHRFSDGHEIGRLVWYSFVGHCELLCQRAPRPDRNYRRKIADAGTIRKARTAGKPPACRGRFSGFGLIP